MPTTTTPTNLCLLLLLLEQETTAVELILSTLRASSMCDCDTTIQNYQMYKRYCPWALEQGLKPNANARPEVRQQVLCQITFWENKVQLQQNIVSFPFLEKLHFNIILAGRSVWDGMRDY